MSEMVERVATAIATAETQWDSSPKLDSGWGWENRERSRVLYLARAAIEAMREPTGDMVDTLSNAIGENRDSGPAAAAWYVMIDAALK